VIEYDPHQWRSTFFALRGSMVRAIAVRSGLAMVFATTITVLHFYVTPLSFNEAAAAHGLIGPALSLLLVFRTNASYDRWWEARKLWGTIVNTCRNLARASSVHLSDEPERLTRVLALTASFPGTAMRELRGAPRVISESLSPVDREALARPGHLPTATCTRITALLDERRRQGRLPDMVFTSLDAHVATLVDAIGACERIHKTPLPFAYVVHLRRAIVLFCGTLPFALLGRFGVVALPLTFVISYVLFGIEEIGVEIEDPFEGDDNDLPLEKITATIERDVGAFRPPSSP